MMDWPASSYSPENHTFITCGVTDRAVSFEQIPRASQVAGAAGGIGAGRLSVGDTSTSNTGNFSALNVTTSKLTWHQHWQAPCYSGSMNTATGITFIGHLGVGNAQDGKGYLEAVDTKTGASLWKSPLMTAPVGAAPVTYSVGGKQYVSVAVGGQSHNDVSRPLGLTNPATAARRQHLHVRAAVANSTRSWAAAKSAAAHEHIYRSVCCAPVRCRPVGTLAEIVIFEEGFHA